MKRLLLALSLACAPGFGTTVVGNVGDDAAFGAYMASLLAPGVYTAFPAPDATYEVFNAQGRIGNNSTGGGAGNNEIGLHWNNPADLTGPTISSPLAPTTGSIQYVWGGAGFANTLVSFRVQRIGNTLTLTFGPLGTPLYEASITDAFIGAVTLLDFRTQATATGSTTSSQAVLTSMLYNGATAITTSDAFDNVNDTVFAVENVVVRDVVGDFTVTGQTTLNWSGSSPNNSTLSWQIRGFREVPLTQEVPEPSTALLAGAGIAFLIWKRK